MTCSRDLQAWGMRIACLGCRGSDGRVSGRGHYFLPDAKLWNICAREQIRCSGTATRDLKQKLSNLLGKIALHDDACSGLGGRRCWYI